MNKVEEHKLRKTIGLQNKLIWDAHIVSQNYFKNRMSMSSSK